jgi:TPP-dependent indolepyruvate ferredoxin oxidoreductase alpha subunit
MIRARVTAGGRAASDPGCAGCPQLGTFRALRRAGLEVQGGLGCDAAGPVSCRVEPRGGRWALVATVEEALRRGPADLLDGAARAGARTVVITGSPGARASRLRSALAAVARLVEVDPARVAEAEDAVARAVAAPGGAVLALSACPRGRARQPPVAVEPRRCNRCGACLSLACPAITDVGGEAVVVDPGTCSGCGLCAPLCRAGAIGAPLR